MINGITFKTDMDRYILSALKEDISWGDVSTEAIVREKTAGHVDLIAKQDCTVCGLDVFRRTFELLDPETVFETEFCDGDFIEKGTRVGVVRGDIAVLLSGERTALNYLQRMSGIATFTKSYADVLAPYRTQLLDTRKTTPNQRVFEKYAVTVGGGRNHRYNLSDGVLLKDNHIGAAGSVKRAVEMAKEYAPFVRKIEVETETLEMVQEAIDAGADIIMLDNMDDDTMRKAVEMIGGRAETECSGNVTAERLAGIGEIGVDYVSCGAITYSAPVIDFSMKNLEPDERKNPEL